jgi:ubiquinone/menaquinone biosynthesis C-methylase UbiE
MKPVRKKVLSIFDKFYSQINENYFYRTLSAVYLFDFLDRLRIQKYPNDWLNILEAELNQLVFNFNFFEKLFENSLNVFDNWIPENWIPENDTINVEFKTGKVYFNLWKDFTKEEYYAQTLSILKERFGKNGIRTEGVKNALDAGCGGGRYTLALKKLGCEHIIGVDISINSIELAKKMNPFNKSEVNFLNASVLELPFDSETFDFVFSNGVLHHTLNSDQGLKEIYRVLKKGGSCWLYLYGGKESLFWDIVDLCRKLLSHVPQNYTQTVMQIMGYPPGRIFHRLDFFYVPINRRYFAHEVEAMLKGAGFKDFKRLKRGAAHDWDEIIHNNPHIDPYIYGEGEMRYLIFKIKE